MDSAFSGFVLDPEICSRLSLGEKRELVHEIALWTKDAPEILSSFTRRELLELICAEMGKVRKYSGYTKFKMIEHLLKLVSKKFERNSSDLIAASPAKTQAALKRQRPKESQLQPISDLNHIPIEDSREEHIKVKLCENVLCRASLCPNDAFCKRCSCCICHCYDDNKDPSLWLTCGFDSFCDNTYCGLSCHLTCALKDKRAGIIKIGGSVKLDGSFYCVSCGKTNGLMRIWRKQMVAATEARRVDVLCLRISLGHKILFGTEKYQKVLETVETALQMLMNEVGPLDPVCTKMARGIVKRLACGAEVQNLCSLAVEAFDFMFSDPSPDFVESRNSVTIRFEESSPNSVIIVLEYADHQLKDFLGCKLWHRKASAKDYPDTATFIFLRPEKRFKIVDLNPSTEYFCKVSLFSSTRTLGVWEAKWITPRIDGNIVTALSDPEIIEIHSQVESTNSGFRRLASENHPAKLHKSRKGKLYGVPLLTEAISPTSPISPCSPCKPNEMRRTPGSGFKKCKEESDYEYSVRTVKRLEHDGHINEDFRVKFLTWFSLKATMQERKVVRVFIDALIDDPASLAEQLIDTFMDEICCEQKPVAWHGLCTRLWH